MKQSTRAVKSWKRCRVHAGTRPARARATATHGFTVHGSQVHKHCFSKRRASLNICTGPILPTGRALRNASPKSRHSLSSWVNSTGLNGRGHSRWFCRTGLIGLRNLSSGP
jgi:hypothetical protein